MKTHVNKGFLLTEPTFGPHMDPTMDPTMDPMMDPRP